MTRERLLMTKAVVYVASLFAIVGVLITPLEWEAPLLVQLGWLALSGICSAIMGLFFAGFTLLFFGEE
jgi:hypothetical protein